MVRKILYSILIFAASCTKVDDTERVVVKDNIRALFVNEGQYGYGTGSLTALYSDNSHQNDLFREVNGRPLGDVTQSIKRIGNNYYVPVNNSNKIEVFDAKTFRSVETMTWNQSAIPMYVEHLGADSIIVSDQSGVSIANSPARSSLMIMDINHDKKREILRRTIKMDTPTFQMRKLGDKLFVVGEKLSIFDMDNLVEGANREVNIKLSNFTNICLDTNGNIWMLAASGVVCIDPESENIITKIEMEEVDMLWGNIDIDPEGRWLYFNVENKIYTIDTLDPKTPAEPLFTHDNNDEEWTTFSLGVSKEGTIFIVRSSFYSTTRGRVFEYKRDGTLVQPYFSAGIFPRTILFL